MSGISAEAAECKRGKVDLDRQILKPLCGTGKMFCYDSPEYVKDMGTPERYEVFVGTFRMLPWLPRILGLSRKRCSMNVIGPYASTSES